jgi:hypothetical protein
MAWPIFPREATREDNRLDIVITLTFPLTSGLVLLLANMLCEFVAPAARGALADWPWWAMLATLFIG